VSRLVVAIHQPQYLPWLAYFDKADQCDVLVHLDTVQYQRRGFQNRNMIKTVHGARYLSVPVSAPRDAAIREVRIAGTDWIRKHVATIQHAYRRAGRFDWFEEGLRPIMSRDWERLVDLNVATLEWAFDRFAIRCRQVRASELDVHGTKDELIVSICCALGASVYLSGTGAGTYQDPARFAAAGIELQYQQYTHPVYTQCHPGLGFVRDLSALDLLLNAGDASLEVLRSGRAE
jgi:hypothetical protein